MIISTCKITLESVFSGCGYLLYPCVNSILNAPLYITLHVNKTAPHCLRSGSLEACSIFKITSQYASETNTAQVSSLHETMTSLCYKQEMRTGVLKLLLAIVCKY